MTPEQIETILDTALANFVGDPRFKSSGAFLLERDANERTMAHHLAIHLIPHFNGWDIDCEYNRDGSDDNKTLELPKRTQPTSMDVDARTVYPDIIVHHRGDGGAENNLLIIEIKKSSNKLETEYIFDRVKLRQFQKELGYRHAYLLVLETDGSLGLAVPWKLERVPVTYQAPDEN